MADDLKVVKDALLTQIVEVRLQVLSAVQAGISKADPTVGAVEMDAWDKAYAGLALVWNGANVVGTLMTAVPVLTIPGAILAGVGGLGSLYAGYQQNFNKPNFAGANNMLGLAKDVISRKLNDVKDQTNHHLQALNKLKDSLYQQYSNHPIYGPSLRQVDLRQPRLDMIWKACFRDINPDRATNQVTDRTTNAVNALFKIVYDYFKLSSGMADVKVGQLPPDGYHRTYIEHGMHVDVPNPPKPADVQKTRDHYLAPDHFIAHLKERREYQDWRKRYNAQTLPGF